MSITKPKIYNLALSALLLAKQVIDTETDKSNEVKVLNLHYDIALETTLQDLDLDSLSMPVTLELLANLDDDTIPWQYVYKYPSNCTYFRRIVSGQVTDNKSTHIAKRVALYDGEKAIFTDEITAQAEIIPTAVPLEALSGMAGMAVAYQLAYLSAPLIVGKGAKSLREIIMRDYLVAKSEAQEIDATENFNYESDWQRSEFVQARLS